MGKPKSQIKAKTTPSPRRKLVGEASVVFRGEGWGEGRARHSTIKIARNRTIQPLTPALSSLAVFGPNVARRRGEGVDCGLVRDFGAVM
jgi:hypothetical protein